ncbi:DUF1850 domain-containing protein [Ancylobacter sp. MQZ15Z-1]|uniref:DUF1850 domain-containing protein n=1 Tax=Ancylobacter mangrovi TaxID=2972472 RepID=A0A9X2T392_9HYPH|nr:DUF1850 domain-containing protein [Ancylobacter mangrovi]MCS0496822.1 DUF1850 domain-containing protein [Ancylobacter mangrovi]
MGACLMVGAKAVMLAASTFTLSWTHSVERTGWSETYRVEKAGLQLVEARVMGSGAGMDPGEGARLEGEWWVWKPTLGPVPELVLAASGATVGGWHLCEGGWPGSACRTLGASAGAPIRVRTCEAGR